MIGETLRLIRVVSRIKANELEKRLDISPSYLSLIENNKKRPLLGLINAYAKIFDIKTSSALFFDEERDDSKNGNVIETLSVPVLRKMIRERQA